MPVAVRQGHVSQTAFVFWIALLYLIHPKLTPKPLLTELFAFNGFYPEPFYGSQQIASHPDQILQRG